MNLPKEQQERLQELARKHERSVHDEIILALECYLQLSDGERLTLMVKALKEKTNGKSETDS